MIIDEAIHNEFWNVTLCTHISDEAKHCWIAEIEMPHRTLNGRFDTFDEAKKWLERCTKSSSKTSTTTS